MKLLLFTCLLAVSLWGLDSELAQAHIIERMSAENSMVQKTDASDRLPPAADISNSIAPSWMAPTLLNSESDLSNKDLWIQRIHRFVDRLANQPINGVAAAHWRTLVLFYPHTDTDYVTVHDSTAHFKGSLNSDQIQRVVQTLQQFPSLVTRSSGGFCNMQMDIRIVDRYITFGGIGKRAAGGRAAGFQHPEYNVECRPEKQLYNDPNPYDNVIVLYYPGPIPQDLRGAGGLSGTQTVQHVQYGTDADWNAHANESLKVLVHEWIHGLDGLFMGRGYRGRGLHHLYIYPDMNYPANWHAGILQGRMMGLTESPYGYSRAVWLSGTFSKPLSGLLPVKLWTPLSGVPVPTENPIRFEWNPAPENSGVVGYRFRLYRNSNLDTPQFSRDSRENTMVLPADILTKGQYVWTVQARNASGRLSPVGESFALTVCNPSDIPPIQFTRMSVSPTPVPLNGDNLYFAVNVSVSSPCGLQAVFVKVEYPDGRVQKLPLRKKSPNENEPVWTGRMALYGVAPNQQSMLIRATYVAIDQGGRTKIINAGNCLIKPLKAASEEEVVECKPLNPLYLPEGQNVPHTPAAAFPRIPVDGGAYPLYAVMWAGDWVSDTAGWIEVVAPDGKMDQVGFERYFYFNGMWFGQYLFPPNKSGKEVTWKLTFCVHKPTGPLLKSKSFQVIQTADTNN